MKRTFYALLICCFFAITLPASAASTSSATSVSTVKAQQSCSMGGTQAPVELAVPNLTGQRVNVYWLNFQCAEELMGTVEANEIFYQSTFDGHEWIFRDDSGQEITRFNASSAEPTVLLGAGSFTPEAVTTNCSSGRQNPDVDTRLTVINNTDEQVLLFWIDFNCVEWLYWVVPAQDQVLQNAFVGHDWVVRYMDGRVADTATLAAQSNEIVINPPMQATPTGDASMSSNATAVPTTASATSVGAATQEGFPVTVSGCEVMPVTADMGVDPFYTKYCDYNGLRFMSSDDVDDLALQQAWLIAANMFFNRPDIVESMVELNMFVAIMSEDQVVTDIPELAYLADDPEFDVEAAREYSKVLEEPRLAVGAEENLLCAADDTFLGENLLVGRLANLARYVLQFDLDTGFGDRLTAVRENALANPDIWGADSWVTASNNDYWDYGVKTYFNSGFDALLTGPTDSYYNTRAELEPNDPQLYEIIDSVFQTEDWTSVCPTEAIVASTEPTAEAAEPTTEVAEPTTAPTTEVVEPTAEEPTTEASTSDDEFSEAPAGGEDDEFSEAPAGGEAAASFPVTQSGCEVMAVTADLGVDPFYTKYCDYNGMHILASDSVDNAAMQQAWLTMANLWYSRPDVVESLNGMGFFVAIMAENQLTTDIPELAYLAEDTETDYNAFRAYTKVLEAPRLLATAEENLVCSNADLFAGENLFVGRLANITRYALAMDLDPAMTDALAAVRQSAIDSGLWASPDTSWITESNGNYWDYGVQAFFNSAPDALTTGPTDEAVNTRSELESYDPELYAIIDSVFQVEDWTPACPTE
jgi:hypothetical protein